MRRFVSVVLAGGLLAVGCPGAAPAGAAGAVQPGAGFHTYAAKTLYGDTPIADPAGGYTVTIVAGTPHVARLEPAVRHTIIELRRYGIDVRYGGVVTARPSSDPPPYGRITVTEDDGTNTVCRRHDHTDSGVVTEGVTYPSTQDVGVVTRMNSAAVTFCTPLWSHGADYVTALALHEFGHAVGLGHYNRPYRGAAQVMNAIVPDVDHYQAGDANGLRYVAAETAALTRQSRLGGAVESWTVTRRGLAVTGWAIIGVTAQFADVAVTRDGITLATITTSTPRPDIVAAQGAQWPDAGFAGSEIPMSVGRQTYCVVASDPSRPATRDVLGCQALSWPPPSKVERESRGGAAKAASGSSTVTTLALVAALVFGAGLAVVTGRRRRARRVAQTLPSGRE